MYVGNEATNLYTIHGPPVYRPALTGFFATIDYDGLSSSIKAICYLNDRYPAEAKPKKDETV